MSKITMALFYRAGVYSIHNIITDEYYIGSSRHMYTRLARHRSDLRKNKHQNHLLQESWNKYGENAFDYDVIEYCENNDSILRDREQFYIDTLHPSLNITQSSRNKYFPEETHKKMSSSRKEGFKKGSIVKYQATPIYQYDLNGNFIKAYPDIKTAALENNIARSSINRYLSGIYRKGGNYLWSKVYVKSMPVYKSTRDNSYLNIEVTVQDLETNEITVYKSWKDFSIAIHKDVNSIKHAYRNGYPYLHKYKILKACRSRK